MIKLFKPYTLLLLFLIAVEYFAFSQTKDKIDSLKAVLPELSRPEERADVLNSISEYYRQQNPDESMVYARQAYQLSLEIEYPKGQAMALLKMGAIKTRKADFNTAYELAARADSIAKEYNLRSERIGSQRLLGSIFSFLGNFDIASVYLFTALKISEEMADKKSISLCLSSIGDINYVQQNYHKAYEYFSAALAISQEINDKRGIAIGLNNLANAAWYVGEVDTYEKNIRQAIILNKEMSEQYLLLTNYFNLGELYFEYQQYDSAMIYVQYAFDIANTLGDLRRMSMIKTTMAKLNFNMSGETGIAIQNAREAYAIADSIGSKNEIYLATNMLTKLYEFDKNTDSVLKFTRLEYIMKDSLQIDRSNTSLSMLELQHKLEKETLAQKQAEDKLFFRLAIAIGILILGLIASLFVLYRSRVRSRILMLEKEKQSNEKVRESEEKLKDVFNSMEDVFSRSDMNGKCVLISPSIYSIIGYTPEEIIGRNLAEFYAHPEQRFNIVQKLKDSTKVENFEIDIVRKDGEIITVSSNAKIYYNNDGEPLGVEGIFRDITAQKKAESEHDKLFNVSFDLLCIAGFDGYFKELNPAWVKATGYSIDELKSTPFKEFLHENDREKTEKEFSNLLEGSVSRNFENRYITKNGQVIHLSWTATPLRQEELMYCIARDVTEEKQNQQQLTEYQKRLKDLTNEITLAEEKVRKQIAVDLHDQVGQILTSIRMQLAPVIDISENPDTSVRLKSISQSLLNAVQATREAIFSLSLPQLDEFGLYAAVQDWMKEQIESRYDIKTHITGTEERFFMEQNTRILLFRSIKELLMNVIKHARARNLTVSINSVDGELEIIVKDDGIGFNYNSDLLRLKGNHFGLFSIQERITNMGGSMEVESKSGEGTKIKLNIPLKEE